MLGWLEHGFPVKKPLICPSLKRHEAELDYVKVAWNNTLVSNAADKLGRTLYVEGWKYIAS